MREWRRHVSRLRWQRRLALAPYVRLGLIALFLIACTVLIFDIHR